MSAKTISVQYDEGAASTILADGTVAERGKPVSVSVEIGEQLLDQGWRKTTAAKSPKKVETKVDEAKDSETNTTTADTPKENN